MKTAIITGATSGLGLECARAVLRSDPSWHLVLPVRDVGRGADAVAQLGEPQRCAVMPMDLASLTSVRAFVENVRAAGLPPLHAIVCNAGVQVSGTEWTQDGVEMTFGVNHLGHFTLVQGLLEELARPASDRRGQQRHPRPDQAHRHARPELHLGRRPRAFARR
jgi:NAD(P)-dependent dehydrogenase (short-subunit alcohol dehydrogenase family)